MDRLHAADYMAQLLAAHAAEDAFLPAPEDIDQEVDPHMSGRGPAKTR